MVKRIIQTISQLLNKKQGSILSAAAVIMLATFVSGILGLVRERLLNGYFTPDELGIYTAAFRLPNLLFELTIMGALSTAFIPVFTNFLVVQSRDDAFALASKVMNISVIIVGIVMMVLFIFARPVSYLIVPAFTEQERDIMVVLTRIMLVGQLLPLIIGNYITGMLQSMQRFILPSLAPVVYNIGIIVGVWVLSPTLGLYGAVWGVVIGAVLFLLIQIPLIVHLGYHHTLRFDFKDPGVKRVFTLMLPRMFGLGVSQLDTTMDLILASYLGTRNIRIFYLAQQLQYQPINLFGATFAQAALPVFSLEAAQKDITAFKKLILASIHQILFWVLPASVFLAVLRTPIVRLVYGSVKFDWMATVLTGRTLSLFAISIFAQSLVQVFARAFYALHDTKTPVIVAAISIGVNTILSVVFIWGLKLPVWGLALSASFASLCHMMILLTFLYRKVNGFHLNELAVPPLKMITASLFSGIFLYVPLKLLDQLVYDTTRVFDLILLTGIASFSGLSIYIFLAWFFDIEEVATFFKILHRVKGMPRMFFTQLTQLVNGNNSIS